MRRIVFAMVCVTACASGGRKARTCEPVPVEFRITGDVYSECEVDQRAKVVSTARPDFSRLEPLATGSSGCYTAEYLMIVDEKGVPNTRSIKLERTNSQSFADAMMPTLNQMRLEPARKAGVPVKQLFKYKTGLSYTVSRNGTGPARRPIC